MSDVFRVAYRLRCVDDAEESDGVGDDGHTVLREKSDIEGVAVGYAHVYRHVFINTG